MRKALNVLALLAALSVGAAATAQADGNCCSGGKCGSCCVNCTQCGSHCSKATCCKK